MLVHLDADTFHVLGAAAKDFAIDKGSVKSRLGPEAFVGRDHVGVAAEEEGGQGGLRARPVHHLHFISNIPLFCRLVQ